MSPPPGLNFDDVFDIALQVPIVLFILHLGLIFSALAFIVAELLSLVFLSLLELGKLRVLTSILNSECSPSLPMQLAQLFAQFPIFNLN
jgi:hypothetical protein